MVNKSLGNRIFDILNYTFIGLLALATLYPFWDAAVVSIISLGEYLAKPIHLFPKELSFAAYGYAFKMKQLWSAYGVTIFITVVGTFLNIFLTITTGYVLSKSWLKGQRIIMFMIVFTMMFSGGIIPLYIVVKAVKIMNTPWALILPTAILTYNLIIMKSFFSGVPVSLEESAKIDGCNDIGILFKIIVPVSMPAIATITLFYAVYHWNEFFNAVMFIGNRKFWPLQLFLRSLLIENEASYQSGGDSPFLLGQPMKMATIMLSTVPIMCVYPFFQKHFVKGVMLGAVKG